MTGYHDHAALIRKLDEQQPPTASGKTIEAIMGHSLAEIGALSFIGTVGGSYHKTSP